MNVITDESSPRPIRRFTCQEIAVAQNQHLNEVCSHKVHTLSCRCSGCDSDERYPVITSAQDAPLLNTAYDATTGGALTSANDAQWEVGFGTSAGYTSVTSWAQAPVVVNPTSAWTTSPFQNAGWISPFSDGAHKDGNDLDVYFRYHFNVASSLNPATFAITMDFYSDNQVSEIWVNGVSQSMQSNGSSVLPQKGNVAGAADYQTSGFGPTSAVRITLDNSWRRCENEIIVYVKSSRGFVGFLAQNAVEVKAGDEDDCHCECDCKPLLFPHVQPCITVKWGNSKCDCLETDDVEVLCITVCNCYSNVLFEDLMIGQIIVTDANGRPVPALPDGTPSVQLIPSGPICFGDIGPCIEGRPNCVSREIVLYTRGAIGGAYRLLFRGVCFKVCHEYQSEQCFLMKLCQD
jgi:hypothetical protein